MRRFAHALTWMSQLALVACTGGPMADAGTDASPPCPADPPVDEASCSNAMSCHWLRCSAEGAVTARCDGMRWDVASAPCPIDCLGQTCRDGEVCAIFQGGAQIPMCVPDPCDGAALESCLCDACPVSGADRCFRNAFSVTCNTCQAEICP